LIADPVHVVWLGTALVALGLGAGLLKSSRWRTRWARTALFSALFGDRPDRVRWLAWFYVAVAIFGLALSIAIPPT
jgi:hypothetical protein